MKNRIFTYKPILMIFMVLAAGVLLSPAKSAFGRDDFHSITPKEVQFMKKNNKNFILLDVRSYKERKEGFIPDSFFIPVDEIPVRFKELLPYKDKKIIVYCYSGKRSTRASSFLSSKGFTNIFNMTGGIRDWQKMGGDIIK